MADDVVPDSQPSDELPQLKYPDIPRPAPKLFKRYLSACRHGLNKEKSAEACGVADSTVRKWFANWPELKEEADHARLDGKLSLLGDIRKAGKKHWQAAAFLLRKMWPSEFGETDKFSIKDFEEFIQAIADRLRAKMPESQHETVKEALLEAMEGYRDGTI